MKNSNTRKTIRKFFHGKLACAGLAVICIVFVMTLLTPVLTGGIDPLATNVPNKLKAASAEHPMGTDELGRDLFARVLDGARITFVVGIVAVAIAMFTGAVLGLLAGYYGGKMDIAISSLIDAISAFPAIILALVISAAMGPSLTNVLIAVGVVFTPGFARIVRGQVLSVRESEYVLAARGLGLNDIEIMLRYILPNVFPAMIVQASLNAAQAIITEASLSFMGVGIQPPDASWGTLLKTGFQYIYQAPWLSIYPGLAIFLVVLSLNFIGDGLRDALDVKIDAD